jgi:hypothetical protein
MLITGAPINLSINSIDFLVPFDFHIQGEFKINLRHNSVSASIAVNQQYVQNKYFC